MVDLYDAILIDEGQDFCRSWYDVLNCFLTDRSDQPPFVPEEALLLLTMKLFEEGKLSLGYAAKMAGYTKRTYMELLGKKGIPVFNYSVEDFERELETIEALSAKKENTTTRAE